MQNSNDNFLKVSIKYSKDTHSWNNFIDYLISFMLDSNIFDGINKDDRNIKS